MPQLRLDESPDPAHQLTKVFNLDPKSSTMEELYGSFNFGTGEWDRWSRGDYGARGGQ